MSDRKPMSRAERLFLVLLVIAALSGGFTTWVDAQGPSYMRQNNPVARQSIQLAPAEIVDAGDAAINTAHSQLYEYAGRFAFNKVSQCPMVWQDGGTWPTSGWADICPTGGVGESDLDWTYNDGGLYLYPAAHPDHPSGPIAPSDIDVVVGTADPPDTGYHFQVGQNDIDRGWMQIEALSGGGHNLPARLQFRAGDSNNIYMVLLNQSGGVADGAYGIIRVSTTDVPNTKYPLYFGTGGVGQWQVGGTVVGAGNLAPVADNTVDIGRPGNRVNDINVTFVTSGTAGALSLGTGTTKQWEVVSTADLRPLSNNLDDLGAAARQVHDFYIGGSVVANGGAGTTVQVLHGGANSFWAAISGSDVLLSVVAKIAAYTATAADDVITCGIGNQTFTVDLPAVTSGKVYHVKNVGTGVITIDANTTGGTTIDGQNTVVLLLQYESLMIVAGAAEYHIL